ncbi:hypothetical protein D3C77_436740 [compost metagenome]
MNATRVEKVSLALKVTGGSRFMMSNSEVVLRSLKREYPVRLKAARLRLCWMKWTDLPQLYVGYCRQAADKHGQQYPSRLKLYLVGGIYT